MIILLFFECGNVYSIVTNDHDDYAGNLDGQWSMVNDHWSCMKLIFFLQDREICCYSISCKERDNIDITLKVVKHQNHTDPRCKSFHQFKDLISVVDVTQQVGANLTRGKGDWYFSDMRLFFLPENSSDIFLQEAFKAREHCQHSSSSKLDFTVIIGHWSFYGVTLLRKNT